MRFGRGIEPRESLGQGVRFVLSTVTDLLLSRQRLSFNTPTS